MAKTAQDAPARDLRELLSAAEARTDRWRTLHRVARALAAGSAQGSKISKRTGLRGIAIPVHPAASRYLGAPAGQSKG